MKKMLVCMLCVIFPAVIYAGDKKIYGLYERVRLMDLGSIVVNAKLDTGALTSSLGAADIKIFEKDGEEWVRFTPQFRNAESTPVELPMVRYSNIKRRATEADSSLYAKRPVVVINICFDGVVHATEVNLTDRAHFNYPLLIGKDALTEYKAIVDPSLKYQSGSPCK